MWIKILKYGFLAAKSLGLDKKIKDWVKGKILKTEEKIVDKATKKLAEIEAVLNQVEPEGSESPSENLKEDE